MEKGKYKNLLLNPAKERINYEIMKLFGGEFSSKTLLLMDEFELLEKIFPFVKEMKKVPPNTHHHLDLFHHVVETVSNIEKLYSEANEKELFHLNSCDFGGFQNMLNCEVLHFRFFH